MLYFEPKTNGDSWMSARWDTIYWRWDGVGLEVTNKESPDWSPIQDSSTIEDIFAIIDLGYCDQIDDPFGDVS
jgi:hypothetical protein